MTTEPTIKLDELEVFVAEDGDGFPPWGETPVYRYAVRVETPAGAYECPAWGSIHDTERGEHDPEGIGWMVLGELLFAAYDPEEFWLIAIGEERPSRERVAELNRILDASEGMEPYLTPHAEAINEHA